MQQPDEGTKEIPLATLKTSPTLFESNRGVQMHRCDGAAGIATATSSAVDFTNTDWSESGATMKPIVTRSGRKHSGEYALPTFLGPSPSPPSHKNNITMPIKQQVIGLLVWLGISAATAIIGAVASANSKGFYQSLVRPSWAPPGWLFGPVWTLLFVMMAVAAWLVWRRCASADSVTASAEEQVAPPHPLPTPSVAKNPIAGSGGGSEVSSSSPFNRFPPSPLALYLVQLVFNAAWTWIFFVGESGLLAFIDIVVLWGLIGLTIHRFACIDVVAGLLLVPYLLWVSFATALTWSLWHLNPSILG